MLVNSSLERLDTDHGAPAAGRWRARLLAVSSTLLLSAVAAAGPEPGALIQRGLDQMKKGDLRAAEKSFEKAEEASAEPCGECQLGLAMVYSRTGKLKKGEKVARRATELLEGHSSEFLAHGELGKICLQRAEKKPSYFGCAEQAFRDALEVSGETSRNALFYLGVTLLRQAKDAEGVEVLRRFVDRHGEDENADNARRLIDKPLRARKDLIPDFELTTLKGHQISHRDLEGHVVLMDFWATWCAPCRAAIPALRSIAERFADDPFMLISLSADHDELRLRDFLLEQKMSWTQVWDGRQRWGRRHMEVSKYPTYVLVGPDGEILYRVSGGGGGIEKDLERRVAKAVRLAK